MANYLFQGSFTPETWAAMISNPHDRTNEVRPIVEKLGGKVVSGWLAFGDYDVVAIVEMPTNIEAAVLSVAASAGGGCRSIKTTLLMSWEESIDALQKAASSATKHHRVQPTPRNELADAGHGHGSKKSS